MKIKSNGKSRINSFRAVFVVAISGLATSALAQTVTTLYSFTGGNDGANPQASLILSGNTLYGTAANGGSSGNGTIFALNTNGTGFTNLYSFTGGNDGADPQASLILSGSTLYGTAANGGSSGFGTVFAINTNGTSFTNLYSFTGGRHGANPYAGLVLSGNTLYGTTYQGGRSGDGTVFAINTNGTGFTTLYSFTNGSDGAYPQAALILSGNTLYGTAQEGGSSDDGTVFALNTNGTGFTTLYSFTNGSDGAYPQAALILSGNTLYGTAPNGGSSTVGTVFAINTNGTGFTTLYSFMGENDGAFPQASLILSGNTLYGTASGGAISGNGTVFALNTNGTSFTTLYSFTGGNDGASPRAALILSDNTLYGTAAYGGSSGNGTVFSVTTNYLYNTNDVIYGYVTDSYGSPIVGINVYAYNGQGGASTNSLTTATDDRGFYYFDVTNGNWDIAVDCAELNSQGDGCVADQDFNICCIEAVEADFVACDFVQITTTSLPLGQVGSPYSFSLQNNGCNPPFTWSSSNLPDALQLNADGDVYGTPTNSGTFNFSIAVTDAYGNLTNESCSLLILPTVSPPVLKVVSMQTPAGQLQFSFNGSAVNYYTIEFSTNLADWLPIMVTNPPDAQQVTLSFQATNGVGFYRAYQSGIGISQSDFSFGTGSAGVPVFYINVTNGVAVIPVIRSGELSSSLVVNYFTSGGTACSGCDYTPLSGTFNFPPGVVSNNISIPISLGCSTNQTATVNLYLYGTNGTSVLQSVLAIQRPPASPLVSISGTPLLFAPGCEDGQLATITIENVGPYGSLLPLSIAPVDTNEALIDFVGVDGCTFPPIPPSDNCGFLTGCSGYLIGGNGYSFGCIINTNYLSSLTSDQEFDLENPSIPININNLQVNIPTINVARTLSGEWHGTWSGFTYEDFIYQAVSGTWALQFNSITFNQIGTGSSTASFEMSGTDYYEDNSDVLEPFQFNIPSTAVNVNFSVDCGGNVYASITNANALPIYTTGLPEGISAAPSIDAYIGVTCNVLDLSVPQGSAGWSVVVSNGSSTVTEVNFSGSK